MSKWIKGMRVVICPSDCSNSWTQTLSYQEHNTLVDEVSGKRIWFNETLKPVPYEGLVLDLDMDDSHICKSVEILKVEE